jgi:hypothetical protein
MRLSAFPLAYNCLSVPVSVAWVGNHWVLNLEESEGLDYHQLGQTQDDLVDYRSVWVMSCLWQYLFLSPDIYGRDHGNGDHLQTNLLLINIMRMGSCLSALSSESRI